MQPTRSLLILAAVAHALLIWAAFPPVNLWPLVLLAPAPLAWMAVKAPSTRFAVFAAIGVQFVLWLWVSRWMFFITAAGFPFYALAMAALNGGVFVWVFRRIHQTSRRQDVETSKGPARSPAFDVSTFRRFDVSSLPMTLTLPIIWVTIEVLRGEIIADGYPWYFLAHPIVESPIFAQSADLFGAYFVSFIAAMVSGAILDVWRWRAGLLPAREAASVVVATLVIHAANVAYGAWRMNQTEPLSQGPAMLVIQTNLPQDNKMRWTADQQAEDLASFLRLTIEAHDNVTIAGDRIDLIVWPETMLPGFGLEPETIQFLFEHGYALPVDFANAIVAVQRALQTPMLVGSPAVLDLGLREQPDGTVEWEWSRQYNSVYLIEDKKVSDTFLEEWEKWERGVNFQRYDKSFLTPFGETMPYISRWPALEQRLLALGARGMRFDLDQNPDLNLIDLQWAGGTARLATPICFESTVGWLNRRFVYHNREKRADVLVNVTNDGWFGFHGPGRVQHAQMSRYRAIENRVPVVRSANTGVSVSIDSAGRIIGAIGEGPYGVPKQAGYLYTSVAFDSRTTLYGRIGDLWAWTSVALALVLFAGTWMRRKVC